MARIPKTWIISDTHWNHQAMVDRKWRPADYEARIKHHWLRLIYPGDTVYHLGDVIISRASELPHIMYALPGTKILIKGNHDLNPDAWYLSRGFHFVAHGILTKGIWLTHAPARQLPDGAVINIHGHLHDDAHRIEEAGDLPKFCKLLALEDPEVNYAPVEMMAFAGISRIAQTILA